MSYRYAFKEVGLSFLREPANILGSVVTLALSLLVFNSFLLITLSLKGITDEFRGKMGMEVYLKDDVRSEKISLLFNKLNTIVEIEEVTFKSKDEALEEMKRFFDQELLEGLEVNPLPASFLIKLKEPYRIFVEMEKLSPQIEKLEGVEGVEYGREWSQKIDEAIFAFMMVDIFFGLLIAGLVIMIVAGNIRNMINSKKESIQIIKLLGADAAFVSRPFFLQGLIQGGLAGIVSLSLLYLVYLVFAFNFFKIGFLSFNLALFIILSTLLLGGMGSLLAIRKHI